MSVKGKVRLQNSQILWFIHQNSQTDGAKIYFAVFVFLPVKQHGIILCYCQVFFGLSLVLLMGRL